MLMTFWNLLDLKIHFINNSLKEKLLLHHQMQAHHIAILNKLQIENQIKSLIILRSITWPMKVSRKSILFSTKILSFQLFWQNCFNQQIIPSKKGFHLLMIPLSKRDSQEIWISNLWVMGRLIGFFKMHYKRWEKVVLKHLKTIIFRMKMKTFGISH